MKCKLLFPVLWLGFSTCSAQPDLSKITLQQWQEDLRFFAEQAPKTHVNLHHTLSKEAFDAYHAGLQTRLPELTPDQITAGLVQWVATLGDGHSHLFPEQSHSFPLHLFWFKEGLFLTNGMDDAQPCIGWQLTHIEGMETEAAAQKVEPYQHRDNAQQVKAQAPIFLCTEEGLAAAGVLKNKGQAAFTFKNPADGAVKTIVLKSKERRSLFRQMHAQQPAARSLYRQKQDDKYWFTWLPASKTLYFQYNEMREKEKEPMADFLEKLDEAARKNPVEKFVVDLRWNGGGNLFTSKPVVEFIANNPHLNQRGKLFVLLSRHTFSAASWFATALEFRTKAIFVGEPTGASPNHFGDTAPLRLPNSGLMPRLSTIYWQNSFVWDKRPSTPPDILVEPTAADWFADRDAALDAILAFRPEASTPPTEIPEVLQRKMIGRYLMGDDRMLEISSMHDGLTLRVADFIQTGLHPTASSERLSADVRTLFVSPVGEGKIRLEAMGGEVVLEKLPPGFQLPGEMMLEGNVEGGIKALRALFSKKPNAPTVSEANVNTLGYQLMKAGKVPAALAVFELNTELYPNAFNTWDSLGEWHLNHGDKRKAIEFYEKSVELNPQNENGKKMLKKLK